MMAGERTAPSGTAPAARSRDRRLMVKTVIGRSLPTTRAGVGFFGRQTNISDRDGALALGQGPRNLRPFAPDPTSAGMQTPSEIWHGTTILTVRKGGIVAIGGDGQVSIGQTIVKANARKVRRLAKGDVIGGFAGATADAFTLFERLEAKLE